VQVKFSGSLQAYYCTVTHVDVETFGVKPDGDILGAAAGGACHCCLGLRRQIGSSYALDLTFFFFTTRPPHAHMILTQCFALVHRRKRHRHLQRRRLVGLATTRDPLRL
jgi:hypothetical protein